MEIERKWLICRDRIPFQLEKLEKKEIEQIYVSYFPTVRARKINDGEEYVLTVKTKTGMDPEGGLARNEFEFPLLSEEYSGLKASAKGKTIRKTRYLFPTDGGLVMEIDIFHEELDGLAFLEIEFPDVETARKYPSPEWTVSDITEDRRYKNSSLAENGKPDFSDDTIFTGKDEQI